MNLRDKPKGQISPCLEVDMVVVSIEIVFHVKHLNIVDVTGQTKTDAFSFPEVSKKCPNVVELSRLVKLKRHVAIILLVNRVPCNLGVFITGVNVHIPLDLLVV
jgi:hypothetical protein